MFLNGATLHYLEVRLRLDYIYPYLISSYLTYPVYPFGIHFLFEY